MYKMMKHLIISVVPGPFCSVKNCLVTDSNLVMVEIISTALAPSWIPVLQLIVKWLCRKMGLYPSVVTSCFTGKIMINQWIFEVSMIFR